MCWCGTCGLWSGVCCWAWRPGITVANPAIGEHDEPANSQGLVQNFWLPAYPLDVGHPGRTDRRSPAVSGGYSRLTNALVDRRLSRRAAGQETARFALLRHGSVLPVLAKVVTTLPHTLKAALRPAACGRLVHGRGDRGQRRPHRPAGRVRPH